MITSGCSAKVHDDLAKKIGINNVTISMLAGSLVTVESVQGENAIVAYKNAMYCVPLSCITVIVPPKPAELTDKEHEAIEKLKEVRFYAVVNADGQFFRRKGYGGYGSSWVDTLNSARLYTKIGYARTIVNFFSKNTTFKPPRIVEICPGEIKYVEAPQTKAKSKRRSVRGYK